MAIAIAAMPLPALSRPGPVKHFGLSAPFRIEDLPPGHVRNQLQNLPPQARQKAMAWLHKFPFTDQDLEYLQIDNEGGVLYSDTYLPDEATADASSTSLQPEAITATDAFALHSKPGVSNVIYLDFNGHDISGTAWNNQSGIALYKAKAFDTDGNLAGFSAVELNQIAEIWHRVAEDYAPFNVDVTTQDPGSFGPTTGRVLITHNIDSNGTNMPSSNAGGVAYVGAWGLSNYSYYSPALVYYNNLGGGFPTYVAEAASHEMGHNLSLSHDGYNDGTTTTGYYSGHGSGYVSWAPIMGVGYYNNVTEWSQGEYPFATQTQDDLALISSKLSYRPDDHANTGAAPTPLMIDANGAIAVTNPETDPYNAAQANKGVIETRDDVDYFAFDAGAGAVNITVTPAWDAFYRPSRRGANLDIEATLYSWSGVQLAQSDPVDETDAVISTTVPAGQYLLAIKGVGNTISPYSDYGSLGQYFIAGSVAPFISAANNPPSATDSNATTPEDIAATISLNASDPDNNPLTFSITTQPVHGILVNNNDGTVRYTPANNFNGSDSFGFTADDGFGGTGTATVSITVTPVNDVPVAAASAAIGSDSFSVNFSSAGSVDPDNDPITYLWNFGDGSSSAAANPLHTYASAGTYAVQLTVADNQGTANTVNLNVTIIDPATVLPSAPTGLTSSVNRTISGQGKNKTVTGTVTLNWTASSYADSYAIWRCTEITTGSRKNKVTTCDYGSNPYTTTVTIPFVDDLPGSAARYKIQAVNANGSSGFSNEVSVAP